MPVGMYVVVSTACIWWEKLLKSAPCPFRNMLNFDKIKFHLRLNIFISNVTFVSILSIHMPVLKNWR